MRNSEHKLVSIRSLESYGSRHLGTRGAIPRDLGNLESMASRQSMRSAIGHYSYPRVTKISVAHRWLRQQVGRPWDDVYSELRSQYKSQRNVADIALQRVLDQVTRNVFTSEDGKLLARGAYDTYAVTGLYVHPTAGVLSFLDGCENSAKERKQRLLQRKAEKAQEKVSVSAALQLRKLDNLWFWVELAVITAPERRVHPEVVFRDGTKIRAWSEVVPSTVCVDVLTRRQFLTVPTAHWDTRELIESYGESNLYAKRKWQASREDIKRHVVQEPLAA